MDVGYSGVFGTDGKDYTMNIDVRKAVLLGGIAAAAVLIGYFLFRSEETVEVYKVGGDIEPTEDEKEAENEDEEEDADKVPPLFVMSPETYMNGNWSKKLVATYFPEDDVLAGYDDELEPIPYDEAGFGEFVKAMKDGGQDAVYVGSAVSGIAYELVKADSTYEEAKAELKASDKAELSEATEELGYSNGFDSVVTSLGD